MAFIGRVFIGATAALALLSGVATAADSSAPAKAATSARDANLITPDPAVRRGVLPNGLRYAVMHNTTPKGAVSVRLGIEVGSFEEETGERGIAHFLEHMAFSNTRSFPAEALAKAFAPAGVAFGRDQNAETTMFSTVYELDLPTSEPERLDMALRWLRDVGDGVEFRSDAVDRERRVVLAERETGLTPMRESREAADRFLAPGLRSTDRDPIGTVGDLASIDAARLKAFYARWYRPDNAVLVIVGDQPVEALEQRVRDAFAGWAAHGPLPSRAPYAKVADGRGEEVLVRPEGKLPSRLEACRVHSADWSGPRDVARLRRKAARRIWMWTLARRLGRQAEQADPPFAAASVSSDDDGRETIQVCINVMPIEGRSARGLAAARTELDRFAAEGLTEEELDQAIEEQRSHYRGDFLRAGTRTSDDLANKLVEDALAGEVFAAPAEAFRAFDAAVEPLTPAAIKTAFASDWAGAGPLLIAATAEPLEAKAVREAWDQPQAAAGAKAAAERTADWAYTDFGRPGRVVQREVLTNPDFVRLTFQNGVKLNFKSTDFAANSVLVHVRFGDGRRGLPKGAYPEAIFAASLLKAGGLGRHDFRQIQAIFENSSWSADLAIGDNAFVLRGDTTRTGLEAQLQLLAAFLVDPGFRPNIDARLPTAIETGYRMYRTIPAMVVGEALAETLAAGRLDLPAKAELMRLRSADFERLLKPVLTQSPLEVTIVGDVDEKTATRLAAATFGALPERKPPPAAADSWWLRYPDPPPPEIRTTHEGSAETAVTAVLWPLYVASPERRREELTLELIASIMTSDLQKRVRQELGFSYAPSASTYMPDHADQGYLMAMVETSPAAADAVKAEIRKAAERLARGEITAEELEIARKPLLAKWAQDERTNGWWMTMLDGTARGDHSAAEAMAMKDIYASITLEETRKTAAAWLSRAPIVVVATPATPVRSASR